MIFKSSSKVYYWKWIGIIWLILEVNLLGGTIFGLSALFEILPQYGVYNESCTFSSTNNSTKSDCSGQTKQYQVRIKCIYLILSLVY